MQLKLRLLTHSRHQCMPTASPSARVRWQQIIEGTATAGLAECLAYLTSPSFDIPRLKDPHTRATTPPLSTDDSPRSLPGTEVRPCHWLRPCSVFEGVQTIASPEEPDSVDPSPSQPPEIWTIRLFVTEVDWQLGLIKGVMGACGPLYCNDGIQPGVRRGDERTESNPRQGVHGVAGRSYRLPASHPLPKGRGARAAASGREDR
jgi:hypothetical protein